ncbi:TetR family transcriptional regulator [Hyella patelloides LEGE 07179]|uniref:TetR family transcriptional regulator n=1 Tax=Hyella patelloides LEGE 07179 TaxID=945734 RepID=A0A563VP54_9CYAN|nr:TetR/AcrR family transcriptional regulator [Hyella patelloides]VEP13252.1 TetR family transcriptional regulator [Hyella patelloides LEGE 07179]
MTNTKTTNKERSKSEAKAEAIIKGAMQEFLKHGYAAASMDKIAKTAKVSKATVYSHFGDKESLFSAVVQDLVKDKFQTVMGLQKPQSLEQEPKIVLSQIGMRMLENTRSDRNFQDFVRIIIGESGRFPQLAQAYVRNIAKPGIEILSQYFKAHPELKLDDPEATVRVMVGTLVYFVILQEMLHGQDILPLENERLVNTLTDLITQHQNC